MTNGAEAWHAARMSVGAGQQQAPNRVIGFDLFRGLAVLGFIFWHSFDLLYAGNRFEEPIFRALFFTTGSFAAVSGLGIGTKARELGGAALRRDLLRGLRLMAYPFAIAGGKSAMTLSAHPIRDLLTYPMGGNGLSTFSILYVLGALGVIGPRLLSSRAVSSVVMICLSVLGIAEIWIGRILPPFWHLVFIGSLLAILRKE